MAKGKWEHEIKSGDFSKLNALMEGRNGESLFTGQPIMVAV